MATFRRKWGTAGSGDGQFNYATGICVYNDEVYVLDGPTYRLQVFDVNGTYRRKWEVNIYTRAIYAYNNKVYIAHSNSWIVYVYGTDGAYYGIINIGSGSLGIFVYNDEIYVTIYSLHKVSVYNLAGVFQREWGSSGSGDGQFDYPIGIYVYGEEIYVVDSGNHRIQVFNTNGVFQRKWGSSGPGDEQFNSPYGITIYDNGVYVTHIYYDRVSVFNTAGAYQYQWGSSGSGDGEFDGPREIAIHNREAYVVDTANDRVQVFLPLALAVNPPIPVPDYPLKEGKYYDTLITNIPGKELSRSRHTTLIRSWILNYSAIHDGDCKYLWDFFTARKGRLGRFYFIHPETNVIYVARFADDVLKRKEIGNNLFNVTYNIIEVTS